jgi:hypothetical protein
LLLQSVARNNFKKYPSLGYGIISHTHLSLKLLRMNAISFAIVHPAFQNLKRSNRLLHLTAAGLILAHAISHFSLPDASPVYFWCQLIISLDIFILVFAGPQLLTSLPKVNLFFRFIEFLFFFGIAALLFFERKWLMGSMHVALSIIYIYLFICEKNVMEGEYVAIHHSGITIPALPESRFYIWSHISNIRAAYDSITIETSLDKTYHFHLKENLQFEELDQIHEFCRHYLGNVDN